MLARNVPQFWLRFDGEGPLWRQLYRALKKAILDGELAPGARLPSTRTLAQELGVARSTMLGVFDQLLSEGYLVGKHGSGSFVAAMLPGKAAASTRGGSSLTRRPRPPRLSDYGGRLGAKGVSYPYDALATVSPARYEFMYGQPHEASFPRASWRRLYAKRLAGTTVGTLAYGPPEGDLGLRRALAGYLRRARGLHCEPEQILITAGAQQAIQLAARVLLSPGQSVLVEDPLYPGARATFEAEGARLAHARVDSQGIDPSTVPGATLAGCRLAYVTPSHQFPSGAVLSLERRLSLLAWAKQAGAYVIEDDYDGEFRYGGRPLEALKALDDEERVLYVGTFSKVLFPSLRLGYVVAPRALWASLRNAKWLADWASPTLEQQVLAEFIEEGLFERQLRRARILFGRRRAALVAALREAFGPELPLAPTPAGLHLLSPLPGVSSSSLGQVVARARRAGVGVYPATDCFRHPPAQALLLFGYTLVDEAGIREGVRLLQRALGSR